MRHPSLIALVYINITKSLHSLCRTIRGVTSIWAGKQRYTVSKTARLVLAAVIAIALGTAFMSYRMRASAAGVVPVAGFKSLIQVREAGARLWRSMFSSPLAGIITGTVFQDFNGNGNLDTALTIANAGTGTVGVAIDRGIAGVTVTAICVTSLGPDGVIGTADDVRTTYPSVTSGATGVYSIATTAAVVNARACRVEFSNLPTGYQYGAQGVANGTATQFVADNATNVNFGISYPGEYCQNNPEILTPCYVFGDQVNGGNMNEVVLLSSLFSSGTSYTDPVFANHDNPTTHPFMILANDVGTTLGLAFARGTQNIFAASAMKKHSGFGAGADGLVNTSDDPGAVYVVSRTTSTVVNVFTVPGATTNAHDTANYQQFPL
jgi:hypothetical protein